MSISKEGEAPKAEGWAALVELSQVVLERSYKTVDNATRLRESLIGYQAKVDEPNAKVPEEPSVLQGLLKNLRGIQENLSEVDNHLNALQT